MFKDEENKLFIDELYSNVKLIPKDSKEVSTLKFVEDEDYGKPEMLFKKLHPDAVAPSYAHEGDSGMDLYTVEDVKIAPGATVIAPTGIAIALPPNTELQVRNRSGITVKGCLCTRIELKPQSDLSVDIHETDASCYERVMLGTVDNGYRGEVGIMVYNQEDATVTIPKGTKLAQAVVCPVITVRPVEVEELPDAARGANGYGSTDN